MATTFHSTIREIRQQLEANMISDAVEQAKQEIISDVKKGVVPKVVNFSELDDHVDANCYGGLCDERGDMSMEDAAKVQDAVDDWIKRGGLIPVELEKKRTILIHLNVEVDPSDERNRDEIGDFVLAALEVGLEGAPGDLASGSELVTSTLTVCATLVEEI